MRTVLRSLLILAVTAGCLDEIFGTKKKADYAISCDPPVASLPRGTSATISCIVTSKKGFANSVSLSSSSVPAGLAVTYAPTSVTLPRNGSDTVWAHVSVASNADLSSYPFTVIGTSGGTTRAWSGRLEVMEKTATVHMVYLVPSDRQQRDDLARRLEGAIRHVQIWYLNALGTGKTFAISQPAVAIYKTPHPASWYSSNNPADASNYRFSNNVQADGLPLAGARVDDPDNIWVFYIDAPAEGTQIPGTGLRGIAVIDGNWLARLGQSDANGSCPAVGILAHELGHAFANLPDLQNCGTGGIVCPPYPLMGNGSGTYPNAVLRSEERDALNARRAFQPLKITTRLFGCTQLTAADLNAVPFSLGVASAVAPRSCAFEGGEDLPIPR